MATRARALVIGSGVQGLTTGIVLAEAGWRVGIRTDEYPENTTSAMAGALAWGAHLAPSDRLLGWSTRSYQEFMALAEEPRTGVHLAPGRMAARFDLGENLPAEAELLPDLRRCTEDELPAGFVSGYRATLPTVDMPRYLEYLVERFRAAGGTLALSPVSSLADALGDAPVVINCAGIGARELVGDPLVHPVRGQHVVAPNPGLDEFFIELSTTDEFASYVSHGDYVLLGGIAQAQEWSRTPDSAVTAGILRRCAEVEPRLADVEVRAELVGLRPGRQSVRLDTEQYEGTPVIHNYGHGSQGVALSWGCALEVAELVASAR